MILIENWEYFWIGVSCILVSVIGFAFMTVFIVHLMFGDDSQ